MTPDFQIKPTRLLLTLLLALLVGWLLDAVAWTLVATLTAALGWHYWQLYRLTHWLGATESQEVPESRGVWSGIFEQIYRLQKQHRQSEAHLKSILDRVQQSTTALRDAVIVVNAQGNIEWWNRAAKSLLGLKRPDDQGQAVINLVRDPRFVRYFEQRKYDEPIELASPISNQLHLQYTITEFGADERLLLVRDVTRLHRLERMRRDFVGNASHELRTPLTVILGYLETLQDQFKDQNPALVRALQQMEGQAKRMGNLVTDMLMLTRLETTDSLTADRQLNVGEMLRSLREDALQLAPDKNHQIDLDVDEGYQLIGQEKELISAFSNLVANAVKYTPEQGKIEIAWRVDNNGGHFSVTDNGIGIETYHLSRLTERFYRVDSGRSTAQGGTGLGLAIVKHVLLRHHARLVITSRVGKGSTFSCHFPSNMLRPVEQQAEA